MIKKLRNSKGYVSIEAIVMSAMILGVGVIVFVSFQNRANQTVQKSLELIDKAQENGLINNPWGE